jgi:hypothetical protein
LVINFGTIVVILLARLSVLIYYKSCADVFAFYMIFVTEVWLTLKIVLLAHYATSRTLLDSYVRGDSESSSNKFVFKSQHNSSSGESNNDCDNFKR